MDETTWWKQCVAYKIEPRKFHDSNGDGIGDIVGIISRLPYLRRLGIGCICLSSVFPGMGSGDGGVTEYCSVDPCLGSMADMEDLVDKAHVAGMHVVLEIPISDTSDRHKWFLESKKGGTGNPYSSFYLWTDVACNWMSTKSATVLEWDKNRKAASVRTLGVSLPDLNWRDGGVVQAIYDQCRFWLDKGIDGLELSDANCIVKDDAFRDNPGLFRPFRIHSYKRQLHVFDRNRPENHKELRRFHEMVSVYPHRVVAGRILQNEPGEPEMAGSYLGNQLDLTFDDSFAFLPFSAKAWKQCARRWYRAVGVGNWPGWKFEDRFLPRSMDRFGGDVRKAGLAAMFLLTQLGTPVLYFGEENGARDEKGSKTFPSCLTERANEDSPLVSLYASLIALRSRDGILRTGRIRYLDDSPCDVLEYVRETGTERRTIVLNFGKRQRTVPMGNGDVLLATYGKVAVVGGKLVLAPRQGVVLKA